MSKLSLSTIGVKGCTTKRTENIGKVAVDIDNSQDYISIDAFEGQGQTYKRRELSEVEISQSGDVIFKGTFTDLCKKLNSK